MTDNPHESCLALMHCIGWQFHRFAVGPLRGLLLHAAADPLARLRGDARASTHAVARLVLRDGTVFGVSAKAAHAEMRDVLLAAGAVLAAQRYDESDFLKLDAGLAQALAAAGHQRAQVALQRGAKLFPGPVVTTKQGARLTLLALNALRAESGRPALAELPTGLATHLARACGLDDPALQAYRDELEPQALAWQGAAAPAHGMAPDLLTVYNFFAAPRGRSRNRAQAMEVLPWLLPAMTAPWNGRIPFEVVTIRAAIDEGMPLYDAVARAFGVPREVVRWLGRRMLPPTWTLDAGRVQRLLALLSWLPPERRPQVAAEFEALTALGTALVAPLGFHDVRATPALLARFGPCMRRWLAQVARPGLVVATAPPGFAQLSSDLADARDFLRALFEGAQEIDHLDHEGALCRVLDWCAGITVRRLLSLSRQWHAALFAGSLGFAGPGLRWPAVLDRPWQHADRTIIELTSSAQLQAEGLAMQHCVASYDQACLRGDSIIVSLRAPGGKPLSTAEITLRDGLPRAVLAQHRAAGNGAPGDECRQALATFLRYLNSAGALPPLQLRRDFQRQQADRGREERGEFSRLAQQAARRLAGGMDGTRARFAA
jgi:hypothetical protein